MHYRGCIPSAAQVLAIMGTFLRQALPAQGEVGWLDQDQQYQDFPQDQMFVWVARQGQRCHQFTALAEVYSVPCLRSNFTRMRKLRQEETQLERCPEHPLSQQSTSCCLNCSTHPSGQCNELGFNCTSTGGDIRSKITIFFFYLWIFNTHFSAVPFHLWTRLSVFLLIVSH